MNKERREAIAAAIKDIEAIPSFDGALETFRSAVQSAYDTFIEALEDIKGKASDAAATVETLKNEEQEYYDNMPENMQNGEKGENAQSAVSAMETAYEKLTEIADYDPDLPEIDDPPEGGFEEAISSLDEASGY